MNIILNNTKWVGKKITAPADTWIKLQPSVKCRAMLKICNQSHDNYLKLAFSKEEADAGIYIPVSPDGLMDQTNFIPTNEIWVAGEGAEVVVCVWLDEADLIKF